MLLFLKKIVTAEVSNDSDYCKLKLYVLELIGPVESKILIKFAGKIYLNGHFLKFFFNHNTDYNQSIYYKFCDLVGKNLK